jgi:hypothetical protein
MQSDERCPWDPDWETYTLEVAVHNVSIVKIAQSFNSLPKL